MSNLAAFLTMVAVSEGTENIGYHGYNCLVGGATFDSYADHPRIKVVLSPTLTSTAAGRYQILERYYDAYKAILGLKDFSPNSQDAIATQMIRERGAFSDVAAGRFEEAVRKCSNIWASLPGNNYGQHQNTLADLKQAFANAGGMFA